MCPCAKSLQSCPTLCDPMDVLHCSKGGPRGSLRTEAHQASLSLRFSRQEYWSGLPCRPPGYLPYPVMESLSLTSPALAGGSLITSATWEAQHFGEFCQFQGSLVLPSRSRKCGGTSLAVQWLRLCALNQSRRGMGLIPGWETKILHATGHSQNFF